MADNAYPKKFDKAQINAEGGQILSDFFKRRQIFDKYIQKNDVPLFTCPNCGYPTLSERKGYEICYICYWEDDGQDDIDADEIWGGPNHNLSLTESRLRVGKKLRQIASKFHGTINLLPSEVLVRLEAIKKNLSSVDGPIPNDRDIEGPLWQEWWRQREMIIKDLIKN